MKIRFLLSLLTIALTITACNKDGVITVQAKPEITLDNPDGIYAVKVGASITITPAVTNTDGVVYEWKIDGQRVAASLSYTFVATEVGEFYLTFTAQNDGGKAEEQLRIDVGELAPPVISFAVDDTGIISVGSGCQMKVTPSIANAEGAAFEWMLDDQSVGTEAQYLFKSTELGDHTLTLKVTNDDGTDTKSVIMRVVERIQGIVVFPAASAREGTTTVKTVSLGRTLYLNPVVDHFDSPTFEWTADGKVVTSDKSAEGILAFKPAAEGEYKLIVSVTDKDGMKTAAEIKVICYGNEASHKRAATASSLRQWNKVYEYTAAPGQFINETKSGYDNVTTAEAAAAYAHKRMSDNLYVSLGGWGGNIVVGFDHSIDNSGAHDGYDFSVKGNMFGGSSEPGVVWVMQDTNANGLPDDEWYELKGSEYGKEGTWQNYAVTYYKPQAACMNVRWKDNRGGEGEIPANVFHKQDYYYPLWIEAQSYTLYGTRLAVNTEYDPKTGFYANDAYDWGYVDNLGSDRDAGDNASAEALKTYFKIANAVNADGSAAELQYIDFVKVQTSINYVAGHLGENSTEVMGFRDETLD